jgi:hypothetical protein
MNDTTINNINAIQQGAATNKPKQKTCFYCGLSWPHENDCPAKGKRATIVTSKTILCDVVNQDYPEDSAKIVHSHSTRNEAEDHR